VVYVFFDEDTNRLVASSRLRDFLPEQNSSLKPKQAVDLLVYAKTEMGFKAVIDDQYRGLIFKDEAFRPLKIGQRIQGFVKRIREDGRIDLSLQKPGQAGRKDLTSQILEALEQDGGTLTLTDKSSPEDIHARFGVSKAAYKKALGALYKQRRIELSKDTVRLA
jgi:hypothetical protein